MPTCCLRGGCLTGPNHSGVELHCFLSYLVQCNLEGRTYRIFGYKGNQVRDNIHSFDVAQFIECFVGQEQASTRDFGRAQAGCVQLAHSERVDLETRCINAQFYK
jgi:CDP-paratose 2-epimerase